MPYEIVVVPAVDVAMCAARVVPVRSGNRCPIRTHPKRPSGREPARGGRVRGGPGGPLARVRKLTFGSSPRPSSWRPHDWQRSWRGDTPATDRRRHQRGPRRVV